VKEFCCGDVVPGCTKMFRFRTDDEILGAVAEHARVDHALAEVPAALVAQVRGAIRLAA
jgi:predicted small metal-binding protein